MKTSLRIEDYELGLVHAEKETLNRMSLALETIIGKGERNEYTTG